MVECHLVTHNAGFYGNCLIWLSNQHEHFLDQNFKIRNAVKQGDLTDYTEATSDHKFHLRPADYHKWNISDSSNAVSVKTWQQHIDYVKQDSNSTFSKLCVKNFKHGPKFLYDYRHIIKKSVNPTCIYYLTVDKYNVEFTSKLCKRIQWLNSGDPTFKFDMDDLRDQIQYSDKCIYNLREEGFNICKLDVYKLFWLKDDNEYAKLVKHLGSPALPNWKQLVDEVKGAINE